jgi:predicted nucleic-acid-binding protein
MQAVDTNVLVRLLARDDVRQTASAERFVSNGAWVSHLVLLETVWVLDAVYKRSSDQISLAVEMLLEHEHLVVEAPDTVMAALETFRSRPNLGFSDCLILEVARRAGNLPLGTFDKGLAKLPGAEKL